MLWIGLLVLAGCGPGEEAKEPEAFDFGSVEPVAAPAALVEGTPAAVDAVAAAPEAVVPVASSVAPVAAVVSPPVVTQGVSGSAPVAAPLSVTPAPGAAPVAAATPGAAPVAVAAAPVAPAAPRSRSYPIDTRASALQVLVKFDRASPMPSLGHDHIVAAVGWSGKVRWGAPGDCSVEITVPAAKLVVDPPGARKRFGLEGETPDGDKAKISDNFQGKRQLDVATYPEIKFKASTCPSTAGQVEVPGEFTMKGKARPVTLSMKVAVDGDKFRASGKLVVNGSDWGLEPFTAPAGILRNEDRMSFYIDVQGVAAD